MMHRTHDIHERLKLVREMIAKDNLEELTKITATMPHGARALSMPPFIYEKESLVEFAAKCKSNRVLKWLLTPISESGGGLLLNKASLIAAHQDNPLYIHGDGTIRHRSKKLGRAQSLVEIKDAKKTVETFVDEKAIGKGGTSTARLYRSLQDPSKCLVVVKKMASHQVTAFQEYQDGLKRAKTLSRMQQFSPIKGIYAFKHTLNKVTYHTETRSIMPYVPGTDLYIAASKLTTFPEFILLTLHVAKALQALHDQGIVHGDLHGGNVLVERINTLEYGLPSFSVVPIDYELCCQFNELTGGYVLSGDNVWCAPELKAAQKIPAKADQDVYIFSRIIKYCLDCMLIRQPMCLETFSIYPLLSTFLERGARVNADERMPLSSLILQLEVWLARSLIESKTESPHASTSLAANSENEPRETTSWRV